MTIESIYLGCRTETFDIEKIMASESWRRYPMVLVYQVAVVYHITSKMSNADGDTAAF